MISWSGAPLTVIPSSPIAQAPGAMQQPAASAIAAAAIALRTSRDTHRGSLPASRLSNTNRRRRHPLR